MDSRVGDSNDHGYGEIMDKGNGSRLDVDVLAKSAGSQFKNQISQQINIRKLRVE